MSNVISLAAARAMVRPVQLGRWTLHETAQLLRLFRAQHDGASRFAYGETDFYDPQFYILDDTGAQSCTACVSRIVHKGELRYVIENGEGVVQAEGDDLCTLTDRMCSYWSSTRSTLIAAISLVAEQLLGDMRAAESISTAAGWLSVVA